MSDKSANVLIITGPTAGGKSSYALTLARERGGVIINADALQIYNALPLLTAQPSQEEQAQASHRLYAHLEPDVKCSAPIWRDLALAEIERARVEGLFPILVGGTGLYIKALTDGLSPLPVAPDDVRAQTMELQRARGNPGFHAELASIDPVMAARLHPNDTQRLIRAYEVIKATGRSLASWQEEPPMSAPGLTFEIHVVMPERAVLHDRANRRLDQMIEQGALEEVEAFMKAGGDNSPASQAIGYRPLSAYLRDECSKEDAIERAKAETRQYIKRQATWCRGQITADKIFT